MPESHPVDLVKAACAKEFPAHTDDCSGFAKAVAACVGVTLTGLANDIVHTIRTAPGWRVLGDGPAAAASAKAGKLVIAGLRGDQQFHPDTNGHVVVVVDGPLAFGKYPTAWWGKLHATGTAGGTLNFAWIEQDRDRVTYAEHDLGVAAASVLT
jgi:hypothetical protein